MGQFSWLDCITEEQILDDVERDVYVLVPKEFGGGHIKETCYEGYGVFGGKDIYDLVADWNREYLSTHPEYSEDIQIKISDKEWYKSYIDLSKSREDVVQSIKSAIYPEWRWIGIEIACYDEDNAALPFPIKITHNKNAIYEDCKPSKSDPNQGWRYDEDDEWY